LKSPSRPKGEMRRPERRPSDEGRRSEGLSSYEGSHSLGSKSAPSGLSGCLGRGCTECCLRLRTGGSLAFRYGALEEAFLASYLDSRIKLMWRGAALGLVWTCVMCVSAYLHVHHPHVHALCCERTWAVEPSDLEEGRGHWWIISAVLQIPSPLIGVVCLFSKDSIKRLVALLRHVAPAAVLARVDSWSGGGRRRTRLGLEGGHADMAPTAQEAEALIWYEVLAVACLMSPALLGLIANTSIHKVQVDVFCACVRGRACLVARDPFHRLPGANILQMRAQSVCAKCACVCARAPVRVCAPAAVCARWCVGCGCGCGRGCWTTIYDVRGVGPQCVI